MNFFTKPNLSFIVAQLRSYKFRGHQQWMQRSARLKLK